MKFNEMLDKYGIKKSGLAKRLGITPQLISNWINGHSEPQLTDLKKIAEFIRIPVEEVLECFVKTS